MVYDFFFSFDRPYERESRLLIQMDTESARTGWQIWIKPITPLLQEICRQAVLPFRQGCYIYGTVESRYTPEQIFANWEIPKSICSLTKDPVLVDGLEMIDHLLPLEEVCIYTGAGLSIYSGIWDYQTLQQRLSLNDLPTFIASCRRREQELNLTIGKFMYQLTTSQPTPGHQIIHRFSMDYGCLVLTENIDNLHQQVGTHVITRGRFSYYQHKLLGRKLLILGVSNDHLGILQAYRQCMPKRPLFVVNTNMHLPYLHETDLFLHQDVQMFLQLLYNTVYKKGYF